MKEKDLDVSKVVERIQQNTYDRKKKKKTIPEALISNREKDIKEEPIHKKNIYRTIRDEVKRQTQRPKLQIL